MSEPEPRKIADRCSDETLAVMSGQVALRNPRWTSNPTVPGWYLASWGMGTGFNSDSPRAVQVFQWQDGRIDCKWFGFGIQMYYGPIPEPPAELYQ